MKKLFELDVSVLDKKTPSVNELALKYNVPVTTINAAVIAGIKVELEHTSHRDVAKEIALDHLGERLDYYKQLAKFDETVVDNDHGIGSVPDNRNVDYLGLNVLMKPSIFLKLAIPLSRSVATSTDYIKQQIQSGKTIGAPWLDISIPPEWEKNNLKKPAMVMGHEGRNRMHAILELYGDNPIEVHLFFRNGLRNRHILPSWIRRLNKGIKSQRDNNELLGPLFSLVSQKEAQMEDILDEVYDGQSSGRLKNYIKKKYGGDITCRKVASLINDPDVNNFYKKRAKWYKSLHCKGNKQIREGDPAISNKSELAIFNLNIDKNSSDKSAMIKKLLSYKDYSEVTLFDDDFEILASFLKLKLDFPNITLKAIPMSKDGIEGKPIIV